MRNILILGSFLVTLNACGSKGPLTLPPPPAAPPASPATPADNSTAPGAAR